MPNPEPRGQFTALRDYIWKGTRAIDNTFPLLECMVCTYNHDFFNTKMECIGQIFWHTTEGVTSCNL